MLEVQIENIIPVTEARDKFNQIVDAVDGTEELYVLTKNGKPAAIVVGVHHLEKLTGESHTAVFGSENTSPPEATTPATPADTAPDVIGAGVPGSDGTGGNSPATPVVDTIPPPAPDFSAPIPTASSNAISFDNPVTSAPTAPATNTMPADSGSVNTPIDSPAVDSATIAPITSAGQAIAPDAVTPDQAGPSADPFAIPSEPLDLPEDGQVQNNATPPAPANNTQTPNPPAPQV